MTVSIEAAWKWPAAKYKDQWASFARRIFPAVAETETHSLNAGVWDEDIFNHMLAIEDRRARRSGRLFILMLADETDGLRREILLRALPVVASSTRETDIIGWKKQTRVLGVIFTQVRWDRSDLILKTVRAKVEGSLRRALGDESAAKIAISTSILPDDSRPTLASAVASEQASRSYEDGR